MQPVARLATLAGAAPRRAVEALAAKLFMRDAREIRENVTFVTLRRPLRPAKCDL